MVLLTIGSTKVGVGTTVLTASLGSIVAEFSQRVLLGGAGACLSCSSQSIGKQAAAGLSRPPSSILSPRGFARWASTQLDRLRAIRFLAAPSRFEQKPGRGARHRLLTLGLPHGEIDAAESNHPGRYAVEVCWEQAGLIHCKTFQVKAESDEDAARKGRTIAAAKAPAAARLEVVDLQPLFRVDCVREIL